MTLTMVLLLSLFIFLHSAQGQEPEEKKLTFRQKAIKAGKSAAKSVARAIDKTAEAIDITLAGKKYTKKTNPSGANISQVVAFSEGGVLRTSTSFGLNLRLPNVEKRLQLRFSSYDEEAESRDLVQQKIRTRPRDQEYRAGLIFFQKLGDISTSFQPQLQLKDPLEMKYILRFDSTAKSGTMKLNPRLELFAHPRKGTGEYFAIDFGANLSKRWHFVQQNSEEYQDKDNLFTTQHGVTFDYAISKRRAAGISLSTRSYSRPKYHLDNVTLSTVFAHELSKKLIRYAVTPYLSFSKSESFKGKTGISLSVDLLF